MVIIFPILFTALAYYAGKGIKKHSLKIYIGATIVAIIAFLLADKVKAAEPFIQGYIGFSLLYIVMFTGALKHKSKLKIKLMTVRREFSIIGFILLVPHSLNYLIEFIEDIGRIEVWFGVFAFVIMIPLFYTSFKRVRSKYKFKDWKKLHKWSYLAYILMFVHLILVAEMPNLAIYIILFVPYLVMKLNLEFNLSKNKKEKAIA